MDLARLVQALSGNVAATMQFTMKRSDLQGPVDVNLPADSASVRTLVEYFCIASVFARGLAANVSHSIKKAR